mmetsp:Transcript_593/g.712  ORF Transcript_593/g.712 Transcript_593/m.712 type:complete len:190 (+) Transcript_593:204-773(+)
MRFANFPYVYPVLAFVLLCQLTPVVQGASPQIWVGREYTVNFNEQFDPWREVRAYDPEDGDLTVNMTITGTVKPHDAWGRAPPQVFRVFYDVKDSANNTATQVKRTCHCNTDEYFLCRCYGPLQNENTGTQNFHFAHKENTNSLCVPTTDPVTQQYSCVHADTPELDLGWSLNKNKLDESFYVSVGKGH